MTDPTHGNKQVIVSLYEECINTGALERLDQLIAPDYVGPQGEQGPDGFRNTIRGLRAGIPDIRFTLDEVLAEGDGVAVRWTWRGTHSGVLREFAPSHKAVSNGGIALYHLKQGKIVRAALQTDRLGLLQQIGAAAGSRRPRAAALAPHSSSGAGLACRGARARAARGTAAGSGRRARADRAPRAARLRRRPATGRARASISARQRGGCRKRLSGLSPSAGGAPAPSRRACS